MQWDIKSVSSLKNNGIMTLIKKITHWVQNVLGFETGLIPPDLYYAASKRGNFKWQELIKQSPIDLTKSKDNRIMLPCLHYIDAESIDSTIFCSSCKTSIDAMFTFLKHFLSNDHEAIIFDNDQQRLQSEVYKWL